MPGPPGRGRPSTAGQCRHPSPHLRRTPPSRHAASSPRQRARPYATWHDQQPPWAERSGAGPSQAGPRPTGPSLAVLPAPPPDSPATTPRATTAAAHPVPPRTDGQVPLPMEAGPAAGQPVTHRDGRGQDHGLMGSVVRAAPGPGTAAAGILHRNTGEISFCPPCPVPTIACRPAAGLLGKAQAVSFRLAAGLWPQLPGRSPGGREEGRKEGGNEVELLRCHLLCDLGSSCPGLPV